MYEPVLMSKRSFDRLDDQQKAALLAAAKKSEAYLRRRKQSDQELIDVFTKAGVKVVTDDAEQVAGWRAVAQRRRTRPSPRRCRAAR